MCSCKQQTTNSTQQSSKNANSYQAKFKNGVKIENESNRGTFYADSLGAKYGITYIPVTITNDSTISIRVQFDFANEYHFPQSESDEKFRLLPLPSEWAQDQTENTKEMLDNLPHYLDNPVFNAIIEPGEKLELGIGVHRSTPSKTSVPIPNILFTKDNMDLYQDCDDLIYQNSSINSPLSLWLKLVVDINSSSPWCTLISCGQISYPEP